MRNTETILLLQRCEVHSHNKVCQHHLSGIHQGCITRQCCRGKQGQHQLLPFQLAWGLHFLLNRESLPPGHGPGPQQRAELCWPLPKTGTQQRQ